MVPCDRCHTLNKKINKKEWSVQVLFHLSDNFMSQLYFTDLNRDILKPVQLINVFMQQSGAAIW